MRGRSEVVEPIEAAIALPHQSELPWVDGGLEGNGSHRWVVGIDAQGRDDGDAEPGRDEGVHRCVVVGARDDVRACRARQPLGAMVDGPDVTVIDQWVVGDVDGGERVSEPERPVRGDQDDVGVVDEPLGGEGMGADRKRGEADVDVTAGGQREERLICGSFYELDRQVGAGDSETADHGREQPGSHALEHAEPQHRPGQAQRFEVGARGGEADGDLAGMVEQSPAGRRDGDGSATTRALDELHPDEPLEARHLLAERREAVAEPDGGCPKRAGPRDRVERPKMPQLDALPGLIDVIDHSAHNNRLVLSYAACHRHAGTDHRPDRGGSMTTTHALSQAVDVQRYPIDDLDAPAGRALVDRCRDQLGASGACDLEGFVRADTVAEAVSGLAVSESVAYRTETTHNLEFSGREADLAADDPLRIQVRSAKSLIAYDQIPEDSPLRAIYESDALTRFVGAALQVDPIHRQADEIGALNVMSYGDGDELGWHVDNAEFVVTIMLQASMSGGAFEYVPMLRAPDDPNPDGVRALLSGDRTGVRTLSPEPGTLALFRGRLSPHRVTPIQGATPRINAVLSYATEPGATLSAHARRIFFGRT